MNLLRITQQWRGGNAVSPSWDKPKKRLLSWPWAVGFFVGCFVAVPVFAATGIRALDEPAIAVKAPSHVALIAITRAGDRLVAVGEHGVITYSDDNGATWRQGSVPVTVTLTCVTFVNAQDGWAAGHYGVILHSTDGGATWQLQLNGIQANALTLAAANEAMSQSHGSDVSQRALRRANFFVAAGPDKPFLSIRAIDAAHVTVYGAYRMVMTSSDGGKDWADWSQHIGDPLSHNLYDVIQVGTDIFSTGEIGLVFRSTDGGQNFSKATSPTDATLFGAVATGPTSLVVFGIAGQAYRSEDSAQSWNSVPMGTSANLTAGHVLSSGAVAVVAENGVTYLSRDAGHIFQPMPEVQPMALYDFVQAPNADVITVGNLGVGRLPAADFAAN